jgi:hypothetical protein
MNVTEIINQLESLDSVLNVTKTEFEDYKYSLQRVFLKEDKLIEDEKYLYEVPNLLAKYGIASNLCANEIVTCWEWVSDL